jgi:hypothetical protein
MRHAAICLADAIVCQHTSAYASIRQHTLACVSIRALRHAAICSAEAIVWIATASEPESLSHIHTRMLTYADVC